MQSGMKVIILCGGLGSRLREQTEFIPKPMLTIGGRPIIWHIMKMYYHHGFREFVLPLGYKGEMIKDYFIHYKWKSSDFTLEVKGDNELTFHDEHKCESWKIHFIDTGINTKTSKRVKLVKRIINNDKRFMLTYGDGVSDVDVKKLLEYHISKGLSATLTGFKPINRFGVIGEKYGVVTNFKEKPKMTGYVNSGYMVFEKKAWKYFTDEDVMLESDVLPNIAKDGELAIYNHTGVWHWMDTQRDWEELNRLWETDPGWKVWKD